MKDDAICPACLESVANKNVEHDNLTPVEFVDGEKLPPICVVCGKASKYHVKVGEKNEVKRMDRVGILSRILGALGGRVFIRIKPEPFIKEYKISVQLPVCESHSASKTLKPIYIDYKRYRMTIPVHREFVRQWKKV